jgi:hypothetical protein
MANLIISDELSAGNTIVVDMKKDEMIFEIKKRSITLGRNKVKILSL